MRVQRLLIPLLLWAGPTLAQSTAKPLPVLTPRITELGSYIDTTRAQIGAVEYASLSPSGKLVAFNAHGAGLFIWNSASKTTHPLIRGLGTESMAWSHQGDALVLSRADEQSSKYFVWTVRVNPETGVSAGPPARVSLSPSTTYTPQFSPDAKWIAYSREDQPAGSRPSSLVLVPAAGGPEKVLATGSRIRRIRWDPDGQGISYVAYADSTWNTPRVLHVPLSGGTPALVFDNKGSDFAPDIRDDGRLVTQARWTREFDGLTLADKSGKPVRELQFPAPIVVTETGGSWRMAGFREVTPRAIQITSLADGSTKELVPASLEAGPPAWFPDGSRLAVMVRDHGVFSLLTQRPDGSERRSYALKVDPYHEIFLFGWNHADLKISPDGRYAFYVGQDRGSLELVDLGTGVTRTLAHPSGANVSTPIWGPDSRAIRYIKGGGGPQLPGRGVYEVSVAGGEKLVRALPPSEFPVPAVPLMDFNTVFIFGQGSTNYRMLKLDGSAPRVLLPTPAWGGAISPDQSTLIVRPGTPFWRTPTSLRKLVVIDLKSGAQRELHLPFDEQQDAGFNWHPDGKSIYLSGTESPNGPVIIHQVPLDGSAPKPVARSNTTQRVLFAVSPDQKYIAHTVGRPMEFQFVAVDFSAAIASLP